MRIVIIMIVALGQIGYGQRLEFDAASIKASREGPASSGWDSHPGRIALRGQTLRRLITIAYRLKDGEVSDGPAWIDKDRFDINAKAATPVGDIQLLAMLQTLLADRFGLVIHHEQKKTKAYGLVMTKGGLKITPVQGKEGHSSNNYDKGRISARGVTMGGLAATLSRLLGSPVSDLTGITGAFDYDVTWPVTEDAFETESSLAAALRDKLGVALEIRKLPVDFIVVDKAMKPIEE